MDEHAPGMAKVGGAVLLTAAAVVAAWLSLPLSAAAENWPAWRGDGSGVYSGPALSTQWDARTNILWKAPLPGEGNSSPVLWGNRIYLTSSQDKGHKRLVLCYDAADGREVWRSEFAVAAPAQTYPKNGYASPTATTDGKGVYVFFDSPGLAALDAQTGAVLWQLDFGPFKDCGYLSASPILVGPNVVQVVDVETVTIEGKKVKNGFIVAVDKLTGKEQWRTLRPPSDHAATPLAIQVGGGWQIVAAGDPTIAYDPHTGREIWSCKGMKETVAPSPLYDGKLLWVTSGRNGPTQTIDPTGQGDVTETHGKLLADSGGPYVPSPLLCPLLMLPGDDGQVLFLDKSGRTALRMRVNGHFTASPILADGRVYWPDEKGRTFVLDVSALGSARPQASLIAVNDLGEGILASPAADDGKLYLRGASSLYCIAGSARPAAVATVAATRPQATLAQLRERYAQHPAEEGDDIAIRLEIVDALAGTSGPEAVGFLLQIIRKDNHWDVVEAAAKALAARGQEAREALVSLLADRREYTKTIAADALGQMKAAEATPGMLAKTTDKDTFVRRSMLRALGRIAQAGQADTGAIIPALLKGLWDEQSVVKLAAIDALGGLADKAGPRRQSIVDALKTCTTDKNSDVASAAKDVLGKAYGTSP